MSSRSWLTGARMRHSHQLLGRAGILGLYGHGVVDRSRPPKYAFRQPLQKRMKPLSPVARGESGAVERI
jgi:hypothetical protein